jgi:proteic killer suppression protein
MDVRFQDGSLDSLEVEPGDGGYPAGVTRAFRIRLAMIRAAPDERDFHALKSLHYEKLKGPRKHQRSMRLNDQQRLVIEAQGDAPNSVVVVVGIEDYH